MSIATRLENNKLAARVYISNISKLWPVEAQEAALAAGTPGWPDVRVYQDHLGPMARKAHSPEALKERSSGLLRRTSRPPGDETIYVASLAVLAWTPEDLMACLEAAAARHATIVALDTGRRIEPTAGAADLRPALVDFLASKRRAQTEGGRAIGVKASKEKRLADVLARIKLIEADWPLREVSTQELLERAGRVPHRHRHKVAMSYITAVQHLGKRPLAQKRHDAMLKRAAKRKST